MTTSLDQSIPSRYHTNSNFYVELGLDMHLMGFKSFKKPSDLCFNLNWTFIVCDAAVGQLKVVFLLDNGPIFKSTLLA